MHFEVVELNNRYVITINFFDRKGKHQEQPTSFFASKYTIDVPELTKEPFSLTTALKTLHGCSFLS